MSTKCKRPARSARAGQFTLFGSVESGWGHRTAPSPPCPSVASSRTSRAASRRIQGDAGNLSGRVLAALHAADPLGLTDAELQDRLGLCGDTERPRRCKLVAEGVVVNSGATRPTPSGRSATVWVLAQPAHQKTIPRGAGAVECA